MILFKQSTEGTPRSVDFPNEQTVKSSCEGVLYQAIRLGACFLAPLITSWSVSTICQPCFSAHPHNSRISNFNFIRSANKYILFFCCFVLFCFVLFCFVFVFFLFLFFFFVAGWLGIAGSTWKSSQELAVEDSLREYAKSRLLVAILAGLCGIPEAERDVVFDVSVGYDLEGIRSGKMARFFDGIRDARAILEEERGALRRELPAPLRHWADVPCA